MIEAIKIWNEPNNLSHWDFTIDHDWQKFASMAKLASMAAKSIDPGLSLVLGGLSPIDPDFVNLLKSLQLLEHFDIIAVHGFPLDWNHWMIDEWPKKINSIKHICTHPVWVTEVGVSTFGADEVQVFGLERTKELLLGKVPRVYWYSLLDLPPSWEATTRHRESEGSAYYRHFYMGLIRCDGSYKPAFDKFDPELGICQWFHFNDPRLEFAVKALKELGVKKLRTGISWADWYRPDAEKWFDYQMKKIEEFDTIITLCFTPPSRGIKECITSPPVNPEEFAEFVSVVLKRYL
jgi:beta-xylosidase